MGPTLSSKLAASASLRKLSIQEPGSKTPEKPAGHVYTAQNTKQATVRHAFQPRFQEAQLRFRPFAWRRTVAARQISLLSQGQPQGLDQERRLGAQVTGIWPESGTDAHAAKPQ